MEAAVRALPGGASCKLPGAKQICVAAFSPGLMLDTMFYSSGAGAVSGWIAWALTPLLRLTALGTFMATGAASGALLARAAVGELRATRPTSIYFDQKDEKPSSEFSRWGGGGDSPLFGSAGARWLKHVRCPRIN